MTDPTRDASTQQPDVTRPNYSLIRRILFPFNGEEPLAPRQSLRVIIGWILLFLPGVVVLTLLVSFATGASLQRTLVILLVMLLLGIVMFGLMGWIAVSLSNRAARLFQAHRAAKAKTARGGRYGS